MESKANYALIGAFVILAIVSLLGFLAYVSGQQFDEQFDEYYVVYTSPPRGISVGSEVRYNELKMGEVIDTKLDPKDDSRVIAHIQVKSTTPIYNDTYGQNEPLGLTGLSYIQLYKGPSNVRVISDDDRVLSRIEGRESQFENILGRSDSIIDNVNIALLRASSLLSPEATEDFHGILENLNTVSASFAKADISSQRITQFMDAIEKAAVDVSAASLALELSAKDVSTFLEHENIDNLLAQTSAVLKSVEATADEFTSLAQHGTVLTDEAMRLIEQLSSTGIQDLSTSMAELKRLMESLNRVAGDLERSPLEFVAGQKKETMELPQ